MRTVLIYLPALVCVAMMAVICIPMMRSMHKDGDGDVVIYAGLAGVGTFASIDGGERWGACSEEVGGAFMSRIHVDPGDSDTWENL